MPTRYPPRCRPRMLATVFACALALCCALSGATAGATQRTIYTGISDPLYGIAPADQSAWLARAAAAQASYVRINVPWALIAPHRPPDESNPGSKAYSFGMIDAAVRGAVAHGLRPVLTLYYAPKWAEGDHRPRSVDAGAWRPDPVAFGKFAHAVAARYSGSFRPGGLLSSPLPRVYYFEIWNEPNLQHYLSPQTQGGKPVAPKIYGKLLNSAYAGIKAVSSGDYVIGGATASTGSRDGTRTHPVTFFRSLFCVSHARACAPTPHIDIVSAHPIGRDHPPTAHSRTALDVYPPDLHRVGAIIHEAARKRSFVGPANPPLWVTEFWWESNPPDRGRGVPLQKEGRYIEQALYIFWKQNVSAAFNLLIRDGNRGRGWGSSYQTGLYFHNGKPKPALTAFMFPFVAERKSKNSVAIWGRSPGTGALTIERKTHSGWATVTTLNTGRTEIIATKVPGSGKMVLRARIGGLISLPWPVGR